MPADLTPQALGQITYRTLELKGALPGPFARLFGAISPAFIGLVVQIVAMILRYYGIELPTPLKATAALDGDVVRAIGEFEREAP